MLPQSGHLAALLLTEMSIRILSSAQSLPVTLNLGKCTASIGRALLPVTYVSTITAAQGPINRAYLHGTWRRPKCKSALTIEAGSTNTIHFR